MPKGTYEKIMCEAEAKYGLEEGTICKATMLTRLKSKRKTTTAGKGNISPLIALEAHFLDIILQLAVMRQPLTPSGAIQLINSLVETSHFQREIIEWKAKHLALKEDDTAVENPAYLGKKYWRNFRKRHPELKTKKAVKFDAKRDDWCTYDNFVAMYDGVYAAMVKSGVAIELPNEVKVTLDGTITDNEAEMYGRKTKYLLTKPEYILFVDEVGCNTSQKNDGNVGGEKFLITEDQRAMLRSSFQDCHFTVLGFTNGKGEPVCCVIIVASMEISAKHIMGLQPWVPEVVGDPESNIEENSHGPLKFYPYGPTCLLLVKLLRLI